MFYNTKPLVLYKERTQGIITQGNNISAQFAVFTFSVQAYINRKYSIRGCTTNIFDKMCI